MEKAADVVYCTQRAPSTEVDTECNTMTSIGHSDVEGPNIGGTRADVPRLFQSKEAPLLRLDSSPEGTAAVAGRKRRASGAGLILEPAPKRYVVALVATSVQPFDVFVQMQHWGRKRCFS